MKKFISGEDRHQLALFPERLDDSISDDNPVRFIDLFIDELDLLKLGFDKVEPADTGRPSYHPSTMLKIYIYGYLNRIQSSRRLERETQRNLEVIWLTGRLSPDFKTIADFEKTMVQRLKRCAVNSWCFASIWECSPSLSLQLMAVNLKQSIVEIITTLNEN